MRVFQTVNGKTTVEAITDNSYKYIIIKYNIDDDDDGGGDDDVIDDDDVNANDDDNYGDDDSCDDDYEI
jgi:hypothetical protein